MDHLDIADTSTMGTSTGIGSLDSASASSWTSSGPRSSTNLLQPPREPRHQGLLPHARPPPHELPQYICLKRHHWDYHIWQASHRVSMSRQGWAPPLTSASWARLWTAFSNSTATSTSTATTRRPPRGALTPTSMVSIATSFSGTTPRSASWFPASHLLTISINLIWGLPRILHSMDLYYSFIILALTSKPHLQRASTRSSTQVTR